MTTHTSVSAPQLKQGRAEENKKFVNIEEAL